MSAAEVTVGLGARTYSVHVGRGLLDEAAGILAPILRQPRVVLVTDRHLEATPHPGTLLDSLERAGIAARTVVVPAGEATKSWDEAGRLLEDLLAHEPERDVTIVALGGGVVGDLVGFAAALFLRGVDYVQVPTTLLAQVDSSVGGKTGINSRYGKNLIGAFHQPRAVLIDTGTLDTLPQRELRAGYAEIVKHAFIADAAYFMWLDGAADRLFARDAGVLATAIRRSVEIKAGVVAADETERSGLRALLNFGHTFAHAFEVLAGYDGRLLHGEAVSIGMAHALRLSRELGHLKGEETDTALAHLRGAGMPTSLADLGIERFPAERVIAAMGSDKKVEGGRPHFILLRRLGEAFRTADVPAEALLSLLNADD